MELISLGGPEWKSFNQMEASKVTHTSGIVYWREVKNN